MDLQDSRLYRRLYILSTIFGFFDNLNPMYPMSCPLDWLLWRPSNWSNPRFVGKRWHALFLYSISYFLLSSCCVPPASVCFSPNLYHNYKFKAGILGSRQKKYEILESMKNPSDIWQDKYEYLVEPSRTSQARFSYFFNPLVKSCQIFILFQSPCYELPDFHNFSISLSKLATFSYLFSLLVKFARLSYLFNLLQIKQNS